jgi:hypothetical protein
VLLLLWLAATSAAELRLPLGPYYRPGEYVGVEVPAGVASAAIDAFVTTQVPANNTQPLLIPVLAPPNASGPVTLRLSTGQTATLQPLRPDQLVVGYQGDESLARAQVDAFVPGRDLIYVRLPDYFSQMRGFAPFDLLDLVVTAAPLGEVAKTQLELLGCVRPGSAQPPALRSTIDPDLYNAPPAEWIRSPWAQPHLPLIVAAAVVLLWGVTWSFSQPAHRLKWTLTMCLLGVVAMVPVFVVRDLVGVDRWRVLVSLPEPDWLDTWWAQRAIVEDAERILFPAEVQYPIFASARHAQKLDLTLWYVGGGISGKVRLPRNGQLVLVSRSSVGAPGLMTPQAAPADSRTARWLRRSYGVSGAVRDGDHVWLPAGQRAN